MNIKNLPHHGNFFFIPDIYEIFVNSNNFTKCFTKCKRESFYHCLPIDVHNNIPILKVDYDFARIRKLLHFPKSNMIYANVKHDLKMSRKTSTGFLK